MWSVWALLYSDLLYGTGEEGVSWSSFPRNDFLAQISSYLVFRRLPRRLRVGDSIVSLFCKRLMLLLIPRKASSQQEKRHRFSCAVLSRCHYDPIYSVARPPDTSLQVVSTANHNLHVRMQTRREKMETCSTSRDRSIGASSFSNQQSVSTPWKKRVPFPMHRREFSWTRWCSIFGSQNG